MSHGTIASNSEAGLVSSSAAPAAVPATLVGASARMRAALAGELAAVGERAADVAGQDRDGVRDVRRDARVAGGQQRREGDERAAAGDGVDGAGAEARPGEQDDRAGVHARAG